MMESHGKIATQHAKGLFLDPDYAVEGLSVIYIRARAAIMRKSACFTAKAQ
jgi:hypothetical protein